MARKRKEQEEVPQTYRFMCIKPNKLNYHLDFHSKEDAFEYANTMNDPKVEWYGIYRLNDKLNILETIVSKRLKPHRN